VSAVPPAVVRAAFLPCVAAVLAAGIVGGLLRAGVAVPGASAVDWMPRAMLDHAFLMVCAFLGTVIGLERAVALKKAWACAAPAAAAASGLLVLGGEPAAAARLGVLAAAAFVAVNGFVLQRQPAPHTVLLLVAAVAWLAGALLHAGGGLPGAVIAWWLAFLVLTIAAERLEMTRLMRRRRGAAPALYATLAALLAGCVATGFSAWGEVLYGASLVALAAWLLAFDIARRTVATQGLSRYMACCLLAGYAWLAVAGVAWIASTLGLPWRDAALHALALGFVFSMIFGHAPVILPALARIKLAWTPAFYLPLVLLHLSLAARLFLAPLDAGWLRLGALLNVLAIVLFVATAVAAAIAWRRMARPGRFAA
jgi:hypothetical protein